MKRTELIQKFISFFKKNKHFEIPSSPLIPENDPTVLFITAGMHPLVPYLLGQKHPLGKKLCGIQKCVRTQDIEEVGDATHHTFFEMLGNWSLGDYWKKESIKYSFEFLTKELKLPINKIAVTCFAGNNKAQKDTESEKIWLSLGIPKEKIKFLNEEYNWWGPAGETGPCGPDTEIFYYIGDKTPKTFDLEDKKWIEIWNNVFMEYEKIKEKTILVGWINCLYDENNGLNQDMYSIIKDKKFIILTNANKSDIIAQTKKIGFENNNFFTLENNPNITNPDYFKQLFKKYNLDKEKVIYFDYKKENTISAKKLGILTATYENIEQIKEFVNRNYYSFIKAKQRNVDTGMGVERTLAVLNNLQDNYLTDSFLPIIKEIEKLSGKEYKNNEKNFRIIADHLRAAVFMLGDNVYPSNVERGYVLRRIIRRAINYWKQLAPNDNLKSYFIEKITKKIIEVYEKSYNELNDNKDFIISNLKKEEEKFNKTLSQGILEFNRIIEKEKNISGKKAFLLFQSYGFPIEMTTELAKEKKIKIDTNGFYEEYKKHQELSKINSTGIFKSGLADESEQTTKLHTATHLLNEALRRVLGKNVKQQGSNINPERLRFDFNFPRKLSEKEIKEIELIVNKKIKESLQVIREEMPYKKAIELGAQAEFGHKYPEIVSVYTIKDPKDKKGWFSKEICTGPHVKNTKEIGNFKIIKEESSASGIRRIKAIIN